MRNARVTVQTFVFFCAYPDCGEALEIGGEVNISAAHEGLADRVVECPGCRRKSRIPRADYLFFADCAFGN